LIFAVSRLKNGERFLVAMNRWSLLRERIAPPRWSGNVIF
jgi:hypothetical protein